MARSEGDGDGLKVQQTPREAHVGLGQHSLRQERASDLEHMGDLATTGREGQL